MDWFEDKKSHNTFCVFIFISNVSNAGTIESCPSSPLFIPAKPKKKSARRTRKHIKEGGEGSTDSEGLAVAGNKEASEKKRCRGQINQNESKGKMAGNNRGEEEGDSRGSYRSTVTEESEDLTRQLKTTSNVTPLQAQRKQPNKTQKILSEHCLTHFSCVREDKR